MLLFIEKFNRRIQVLMKEVVVVGWERDYMLNGRPYKTGQNILSRDFEYGSLDEEDGISFADALRGMGLKVVEGVVITGDRISLDGLIEQFALEFGPATSDVTVPPVLENA